MSFVLSLEERLPVLNCFGDSGIKYLSRFGFICDWNDDLLFNRESKRPLLPMLNRHMFDT